MNASAQREADKVGRGRELALLLLCTLEGVEAEGREAALELALQSEADEDGALAQLEALRRDAKVRAAASKLVREVLVRWVEIDARIEAASQRWRLDRMHQVDRNLLRLAVVELEGGKPSATIVASEVTRLAGLYGAEHSARFVNGVVDTLREGGA